MTHQAFYEAAAQIIPLLFILLVIQERRYQAAVTASSRRVTAITQAVFVAITVTSFVLAEYLAIDALYAGHDGLFYRTFVHSALTFLLIGVLGFGLAESLKPAKERLFDGDHDRLGHD